MAQIILLALIVLAVTGCQSAVVVQTVEETLSTDGPSAYVYNPLITLTAGGTNGTRMWEGGESQTRMVMQWPTLAGNGISQTSFRLDACAMRAPHSHMYASGLLYAIKANALEVGFTTEEGKPVVNTITTGASALFPQGLIHYQTNTDCEEAIYVITYNSEKPGTQNTVPGLFGLPDATVAAALGLTPNDVAALQNRVPTDNLYQAYDLECVKRCNIPVMVNEVTFRGNGRKMI